MAYKARVVNHLTVRCFPYFLGERPGGFVVGQVLRRTWAMDFCGNWLHENYPYHEAHQCLKRGGAGSLIAKCLIPNIFHALGS